MDNQTQINWDFAFLPIGEWKVEKTIGGYRVAWQEDEDCLLKRLWHGPLPNNCPPQLKHIFQRIETRRHFANMKNIKINDVRLTNTAQILCLQPNELFQTNTIGNNIIGAVQLFFKQQGLGISFFQSFREEILSTDFNDKKEVSALKEKIEQSKVPFPDGIPTYRNASSLVAHQLRKSALVRVSIQTTHNPENPSLSTAFLAELLSENPTLKKEFDKHAAELANLVERLVHQNRVENTPE